MCGLYHKAAIAASIVAWIVSNDDNGKKSPFRKEEALPHEGSACHLVTLRPFTPAAVAAFAFAFSCGRSARTASPAFHISLSCIA